MQPLDYWFLPVCLPELRRSSPGTMEELIGTMEEYTRISWRSRRSGERVEASCAVQAAGLYRRVVLGYKLKKIVQAIEE